MSSSRIFSCTSSVLSSTISFSLFSSPKPYSVSHISLLKTYFSLFIFVHYNKKETIFLRFNMASTTCYRAGQRKDPPSCRTCMRILLTSYYCYCLTGKQKFLFVLSLVQAPRNKTRLCHDIYFISPAARAVGFSLIF